MRKPLYLGTIWIVTLISVLLTGSQAWAQTAGKGSAKSVNRLEKTAADVIAATTGYRAALERVLSIYERELARRNELAELRQDLFERGVLSRREFEDGTRARAEAQRNVEETRRAIEDSERMLMEAHVAEALARSTPLARGGYEETATLIRFNGAAAWTLTAGTSELQHYFLTTFRRPLPISALGQTPLHDRMGFDHRNALDVAVHPDSTEGRVLMEHLRASGIPFIAARGAIPGSASGAHIHVGQPSPRISAGR